MNEESYTDDADVSQLEQRIDELEATIRKMLPSRREAIGMGVAGLAGASLMSGTASAGSAQVGTIGDNSNLVDLVAEDVTITDTLNTASISGAAADEALLSDGSGNLTFGSVAGGIPANFTYVDETSNRTLDTVFTNTTGSALYVLVTTKSNNAEQGKRLSAYVDNQNIIDMYHRMNAGDDEFSPSHELNIRFFVPNGSTYEVEQFNTSVLEKWFEAEM